MGNPKVNIWKIAIKKRGEDIFDLSGLKILEPPVGYYWADPFIYEDYLFYELYDYEKGVIAYSKINPDLSITEPTIVIDSATHCSFPSLFEAGGEIYMTPETVLSGNLRIYKAIKFPDKWELFSIVGFGRFDDPILFRRGNKYVILATEDGDKQVTFESDHISGGWERRGTSEIKDIRSAGRPFFYKDRMIRPTQDWIPDYGKAIVFKDMETNNEIYRIDADWAPKLIGTHTFNMNDKYVVLDLKMRL